MTWVVKIKGHEFVAPPWAGYFAVDANGHAQFFSAEPARFYDDSYWEFQGGNFETAGKLPVPEGHRVFPRWTKSLRKKPFRLARKFFAKHLSQKPCNAPSA